MELRTYLAILWRRKWVIVVTIAITVTVVIIGTLLMTPTYIAVTTLRVAPVVSGSAERLGWDDIQYGDRLMNTYTNIATSDPVLEELRQRLDLIELPRINIEVPANTELMQISVEDSDPLLAKETANLLADILIAQSKKIVAQSRGLARRAGAITVIAPAIMPKTPSQLNRELIIIVGFVIGSAGGIGLAFLFESLDTRLYTIGQIEAVTELSVLGKISTTKRQQQVTFLNGNSPQGESFRHLRTNIFAVDHDPSLRALLVTSAEPREGKSTVVANLALTMAQSGREIIVVDGDLRLPTLHKIFNLSNKIGLSSILRQEVTLQDAVQDSSIPGVHVLTSGPLPSNPAELLGSPQMTVLLEQLRQQFDTVLLDTPASLAVTDAAVLAPAVDAVLLVVGQAQVRREVVRDVCQQLAVVKARLIGIVVNRAEQDHNYHYYHRKRVE